ncbi:hypothetical protein DFH08DRAFT_420835 [Mycena albidolilacea]|uniref:Uncharacterized protein n=1 Tax=Mycena albidolilacea TaxID=1033008 RepID=A0AAD7EED2_9AGAR|nr:hypothetical protein DFH08DRAFT_420835 [Mycena albidolilacea]
MKTTAAHRKKHAAGIHPLAAPYDCVISAHPTHSATSAPDRIRRTSARARKPPPTTSPTAPAAPPPPILLSRLLLAEKRRDEQPPTHPCALRACRTRCRSEGRGSYRAVVHHAPIVHAADGLRHSGQLHEMGQQELVHSQKLLAARDEHGRTTCMLSSRDAPMETSRTARVCVSALIDPFIGGAGRGREGEAADGSMS